MSEFDDDDLAGACKRINKRRKEREQQLKADGTIGDRMINKAECRWVSKVGFECFTILNHLEDEMPPAMKELLGGSSFYCGYVRVNGRPFKAEGYEGLLTYVPVHGGITYHCRDSEGCVIYGFDCHHANDTPEIWTREAVIKETEHFALALSVARDFEAQYLRRAKPRNEMTAWGRRRNQKREIAKGQIIMRYQQSLTDRGGRHLNIHDNFGAMMRLLGGEL